MKNILIVVCCLLVMAGKAQTQTDTTGVIKNKVMSTHLASAVLKREFSNTTLRRQAIHDLAIHIKEGDAQAMHTFGMVYYMGVDWKQNYEKARKWFEAAARRGYAKSGYNLSSMYRTGTGVEQDFEKAYQYICQAAEGGHVQSQYGRGYFLYKGLGCTQSYAEALKYFRMAAQSGHGYAMYMIGLCYRNGYGIAPDSTEAIKWLTEAMRRSVKPASEELQMSEVENSKKNKDISNLTKSAYKVKAFGTNQPMESEKSIPDVYLKIKHQLTMKSRLAGEYTGYAVKYDWSGQHPIAKTSLKLVLEQQGDSLIGTWTENDTLQTAVHALISDTALVFNNTGYTQADHYNQQHPNVFRFRNARLQLLTRNDTVMIAGNLQLFSLVHNEPEKPMYISLSNVTALQKALVPYMADKAEANVPHGLEAFPNPFKNSVQVNFSMSKAGLVVITIYDTAGRQVFSRQSSGPQGNQTQYINPDLMPGTYLLSVNTGDRIEKTILVKL